MKTYRCPLCNDRLNKPEGDRMAVYTSGRVLIGLSTVLTRCPNCKKEVEIPLQVSAA